MRTIIVFCLLVSFTVAAAAVSVDTPDTSVKDDDEDVSSEKLQCIAESFVDSFGESSRVSDDVGLLLKNLRSGETQDMLGALKNLAGQDFSREQLVAYAALLRGVVPMILQSSLKSDNEDVNKAIGDAIVLLRDKHYLLASNAVFEALGYVEPGSAQHDLLKGVLESCRPLLKGGDLLRMLDTGIAMFNQKQSQEEAL